MCEYCAVSETQGESLEVVEEDPRECDWMPDPDKIDIESVTDPDEVFASLASCRRPATCVVLDKFAEEHFCEKHRREEKQGLGEFLGEFGHQQSAQFLPINAEAQCDYMGSLFDESVGRCGNPATHVKMVTQETIVCDVHARESGYPRTGNQHP